ncbi:MAG: hypothetical protein AABY07_00365 [Nanoarchaeota archaeon]
MKLASCFWKLYPHLAAKMNNGPKEEDKICNNYSRGLRCKLEKNHIGLHQDNFYAWGNSEGKGV